MTVLVTGASGFIGSHVVLELLRRGYSVRAMMRDLSYSSMFEENERLEFVKADLLDVASLKNAILGCNDVVHCAASLHIGTKNVRKDVLEPSIKGIQNLCSVMGGVDRIVHTSSVAAIRPTKYQNGQTFSSKDWCRDASPNSNPYGYAKSEAEIFVRDWSQKNGVKLVTINPSIVFGPILHKKHIDGSMSYLKHFSRKSKFVLDIHINFVDVRDVAIAHVNALDLANNGDRFLIHKTGMWMKEIGEVLNSKMGRGFATMRLPNLIAYTLAFFHPKLSIKMLRSALGRYVNYDVSDSFNTLSLPNYEIINTLEDSIMSIRAQD